jgi:hypothetical protein
VKRVLTAIVGLPILYAASFGPACWLCERGIIRQRFAWILYRPITWRACNGSMRTATLIQKYASLFGDKRRIKIGASGFIEPESVDGRIGLISPNPRWQFQRSDGSVSPIDLEIDGTDIFDVEKGRHVRR